MEGNQRPRTLGEIIQFGAQAHPHEQAVTSRHASWSFLQLWARICGLGHAMANVSPQPIGILSENVADFVTLLYGLPELQYPVVPINIRHNPGDIQAQIDQYDIAVLVASPQQLDRVETSLSLSQFSNIFTLHGSHRNASFNLTDALDHYMDHCARSLPAPHSLNEPHRSGVMPEDCAWIINTSGTTGVPKGVMLSHNNILGAIRSTAIGRPLAPDDVYLFPFPLFHVAAYNVINTHWHQRPVVLMEKFEANEFLDLVTEHGVTNCSLAPTMIQMLLQLGDSAVETMSSLKQISYGASPMPRDLLVQLSKDLPEVALAQGYGMTELGGNAVFLSPEDHRMALRARPELLSAAGLAPETVQVRIVNEHGTEVENGAPGEIVVSGPQVCLGYWNDEAATAASRFGRWFRTGDIGVVDESGYLYVLDRLKDIIITGGENVSSREVEDVLSLHPHVRQIAVIGVPDQQWGELISAVIVVDNKFDLQEFRNFIKAQLSSFKQPRVIHIVEELPINASGKIDKVALRNQYSHSE